LDKNFLFVEESIGNAVLYVKAILATKEVCGLYLFPIERLYELEKLENNITGRSD
jgi:hypothetical protein